jgi:hypothetical protein
VWAQKDVEAVVRQRVNEKNERRCPPGTPGKWLTTDLWQDDEFGVCGRDGYLADRFGRSKTYFVHRRRHAHPALNPAVNAGRPRSRRLPKLTELGRVVIVSCMDDFDKIAAWDQERDRRTKAAPDGWQNAADLAAALNIGAADREGRMCLSFALRAFRQERPRSAEQAGGRRHNGRLLRTWHYDPQAFRRWLGGRSIQEAAAPLRRRKDSPTGLKRLRRAVLFLQFVLTHGGFSVRHFERFVAEPPDGELQPCLPVPKRTILAWAKRAGIEPSKMLKRAKKEAGVMHQEKGFQGPSEWYLPGPVRIEPLDRLASSAPADPAESTSTPRRRRPGRTTAAARKGLGKFCYVEYRLKGRKRPSVFREARKQFDAPKNEAEITTYANRYATHHGAPLIPADEERARLLRNVDALP